MKMLRKYHDVLKANECLTKPTIPELPKTEKKLSDLLVKQFEVLWESEPVSEWGGYHPGGIAVTNLRLKCPFCGMEFSGVRRSGCFMHDIFPNTCPNCNFPNNVLKAAEDLWSKKK
jgi:hypothetical protein